MFDGQLLASIAPPLPEASQVARNNAIASPFSSCYHRRRHFSAKFPNMNDSLSVQAVPVAPSSQIMAGESSAPMPRSVDAAHVTAELAPSSAVMPPKPGTILVNKSGGSVYFCVSEHDQEAVSLLAELLRRDDFAGVIFTRPPESGAPLPQPIEIDISEASADAQPTGRARPTASATTRMETIEKADITRWQQFRQTACRDGGLYFNERNAAAA
jgi:hypothetical protein